MSKRDKRSSVHRTPPPEAGAGEPRARIDALIAAGKAREALDLAKQWLKETRAAEAEAALLSAYDARIRQMLAQGLHDEATSLAALVGERFPAHRQRIGALVSQSKAIAAGDLGALLDGLGTAPPDRRREIEALLTRELRDPRLLADAPGLAAEDPLRRAARAVADLLAAVTTGPLAAGALAALDGVPRHSPLAPWKLLIRALDAYYRRADGAAIANLEAIPPHAAPARLAPVLRQLIGEPAAVDLRAPAVSALIKAVAGNRSALRQHLARLARALDARDQSTAAAVVERIMPLFETEPVSTKRLFAATLLGHWHRLDLSPKPVFAALRGNRRDLEWQRETDRLAALALERIGAWDEALFFWHVYLAAASRAGVPGGGRAASRILLHMAELFPPDREEVLDIFDAESEEDLDAAIRDGEVPEYADRGGLLSRARELDPDPRVFRALVAHWEARDPQRAESEARAWRQAHPRDLEPILHLARTAERSGAHRQALELLDEAEAIDRVHPEVRQSRWRILLASAERRLREGRHALALEDLDRLEREPGAAGDAWVYLGAVRALALRRSGDGPAAIRLADAMASRLGNPAMLGLVTSSVAEAFGLEPPDIPDPASPAEAVQAVARAADLFRALDRPIAVPPPLLERVEHDLAGASPAELHSLCAGGLSMKRPGLTYAAAGAGLAIQGPLLHRFLLARGRALAAATARRERDRAALCLRAARDLAGRARDIEAVREASAALATLTRPGDAGSRGPAGTRADAVPLTADEIAQLIASERAHRAAPVFSAEKPRRQRRRTPRRSQPDLFDDFLAFTDRSS